jgi:hypothetical protein
MQINIKEKKRKRKRNETSRIALKDETYQS